jgi:hypothetical protein
MKYIPYRIFGNWETKSLLIMVMNQSAQGMMLDEMRRRTKVMDQVDEAKVYVILKDDDHKLVCDAIRTFRFGLANRDLLAALDGILEADEPPAPMLETKPKANGVTEKPANDTAAA